MFAKPLLLNHFHFWINSMLLGKIWQKSLMSWKEAAPRQSPKFQRISNAANYPSCVLIHLIVRRKAALARNATNSPPTRTTLTTDHWTTHPNHSPLAQTRPPRAEVPPGHHAGAEVCRGMAALFQDLGETLTSKGRWWGDGYCGWWKITIVIIIAN